MLLRALVISCVSLGLPALSFADEKPQLLSAFYCADEPRENAGLVSVGLVMRDIALGKKTPADLLRAEEEQVRAGRCFRPATGKPFYVVLDGMGRGNTDHPYTFMAFRVVPSPPREEGYAPEELASFPRILVPLRGLTREELPEEIDIGT